MQKEKIELVLSPTRCSGCGACMTVCPKKAIVMLPDSSGYMYPVIDHDKCVRCGKCVRICEFREPASGVRPMAAYAATGTCGSLVKNSASGGVFASLASQWVRSGKVVAGAVMKCSHGSMDVYHLLSGQPGGIQQMQGSKYVQSEAWRCYDDVAAALKDGQMVLFSGTPCQVAAIKRLTGNPERLVTIDLICHGVPSLQMLNDSLKILARRFWGRIVYIGFRDKSCGKNFCARVDVQQGKNLKKFYLRSRDWSFYQHFLEAASYRSNCYECPYAKLERISDLTIGDYWGVEEKHAADFQNETMSKQNSWSCILVNTEKGRWFLEQYGQQLQLIPSQPEWAAEKNRQLNQPASKPANREKLMQLYAEGGYAAVEREYIRAAGGKLRFYVRMLKSLRRNQKAHMKNEGRDS